MSLIYCYGIIGDADLALNTLGLQGSKIYTIPFKDIYAVVSVVSEEEFSQKAVDKNVKDILWLTQNAPLHETVVTSIMQKTIILPMKFCTIFQNKEQLQQMLESKYADVKYFLHNVNGKVEMSLKIYSDISKQGDKVREESIDIQKLEQEANSKTPGQAYFIKQKAELLLKDKVRQQIQVDKKKIMDKIKELFIEIKKNDVLARKVTGKEAGMEMVLNLALLVQKDNLTNLDDLVRELKEELVLYQLELTGPFAAYNFVR